MIETHLLRIALITPIGLALCADVPMPSPVETRIQRVILSPKEAWITRVGTVQLNGAGLHRICVPRLPSGLGFDDIRVSAQGPEGTRLGEVGLRKSEPSLARTPEWNRLNQELEHTRLYKEQLELRKKLLENSRELGDSVSSAQVQTLERLMGMERLRPQQIETFIQSLEQGVQARLRQISELEAELAQTESRRQNLESALTLETERASKLLTSVSLDLECPNTAKVEIHVSYRTTSASWRPLYEARLNENRSKLEWMLSASIHQDTDETWTHAELEFLTTSQQWDLTPPAQASLPALHYQETRPQGNLFQMGQAISPAMPSVHLKAAGPVDVFSGQEQRLRLAVETLTPTFRYLAIPRSTWDVFLVALAHPSAALPLVPGSPVQLMQGNERLGTWTLEAPPPGEALRLCFGAVPGLQARYHLVENSMHEGKDKAGFRIWSLRERFQVESTLETPIEVEVQDRRIHSGTDSVQVEQESTPSIPRLPTQTDLQGWTLHLEPRGKAEFTLKTRIQGPLVGRITQTGDLNLETHP